MGKYFTIDEKTYNEYANNSNYTHRRNGMGSEVLDEKGEIIATEIHGFAYNTYSLLDKPNLETFMFINKLINGK